MKYIIENIYNFSYNKKYILIECEKHNVSALIIDGTIDIIIINSDKGGEEVTHASPVPSLPIFFMQGTAASQ